MENQMKVTKELERIYPRFEISCLVAEQSRSRAYDRQEVPISHCARQLQCGRGLLSNRWQRTNQANRGNGPQGPGANCGGGIRSARKIRNHRNVSCRGGSGVPELAKSRLPE